MKKIQLVVRSLYEDGFDFHSTNGRAITGLNNLMIEGPENKTITFIETLEKDETTLEQAEASAVAWKELETLFDIKIDVTDDVDTLVKSVVVPMELFFEKLQELLKG